MITFASTTIAKRLFFCGICFALLLPHLWAQSEDVVSPPNPDVVEDLYNQGDYEAVVDAAGIARSISSRSNFWWTIEAKALLSLGRYEDAQSLLEEGVSLNSRSLRLRLLAIEAGHMSGKQTFADEQIDAIRQILGIRNPYGYDLDELVALGEAALLFDVEPRLVLTNFFGRAQAESNPPASAFLASGNLALQKHDDKLASKTFQEGLKILPFNPDLLHGLAVAFLDSDRSQLISNVERALAFNPRHTPSLLLLAEHLIDSESYEDAAEQLDLALKVNPRLPEAFALKAVLAYLNNDRELGDEYRLQALATWHSNPKVSHLIGKKLSQNYWFEEGAHFQRLALAADENYTPARIQLAQDTLRLGNETEGWELAKQAHDEDPYDISAYNLVTLHDKLDADFTILTSENFRLKMSKQEALIYGPRALELLEEFYRDLSAKYGITLDQAVTVEIYPNPKDFEVRTFGMPGNPGYLGVCFGPVFTMNSPASQRANWEAVLYHEFCHVITLGMTNNKMPRWLSEGISVYEERLKDSSWGRMMSVDYKERILSGRMQPISEMSAAFLKAQSNEDIQFAYFQSALVLRFLFENYGLESIRSILTSLGEGTSINEALENHLDPLTELDESFANFAKAEATQLGGDFQFSKPETNLQTALSILNPKENYFDELNAALELVKGERWEEARSSLEALIKKAGYLPADSNAHIHLANVYQELEESDLERDTLTIIAENEGDRLDAIARLFVIAKTSENWNDIKRWSHAWLAINPMAITPVRSLLDAEEMLKNADKAIAAGKVLIQLDPPDIAQIHYRLATLLQPEDHEAAHRHTLMALEDAPRFQAAYSLLDTLNRTRPIEPKAASIPETLSTESIQDQIQQLINN